MQAHAVNPATRHSAQPLLQGRARRGAECQATSSGGSPHRQQKRRARQPGLFEVKVVTPPPKSLGIYALPPLTHTGEEIEVDGQGYVGKLTTVVVQFKLQQGKYARDHSRLEVQPTGRYFLNLSLENALRGRLIEAGDQD
ncbi:hypothetical protein QJQ45_020015 [Haematococcus lacustris]|nr:hypothetical protein QJQ45_020015 [Haematococcus lacustris]